MPSRNDFAATVRRVFAAAGDLARPAELIRHAPGGYDPASGAPTVGETAASGCRALFDHDARPRFGLTEGLEIGPDEVPIWLSGAGFAPRPGDRLAVDGAERTIRYARNLLDADVLFLVVAK